MNNHFELPRGTVAGRDAQEDKSIHVDLRIGGEGIDQRISIGTLIAGPVYIHLTVDRAGEAPADE